MTHRQNGHLRGVESGTPEPLTLLPSGDWSEARCTEVDPEIFFTEDRDLKWAAMRVCAGCPLRQACAERATANLEHHGIWGGLDFSLPYRQRRRDAERIRKSRKARA